ncbi:hypothetical protein IMZ48_01970, partial [Candidatus Bathyarchaeota archaeon]|nr:hypothetical protein [Candidatus Bathyarchaeota archaeon]
DTSDEEDSDDPDGHVHDEDPGFEEKPFRERVREIGGAFEKHLKFVSDGLRAVARAAADPAAAKWDILAEMLEAGLSVNGHQPFA